MPLTKTPSPVIRLKGSLPPSGRLPASLQTLACRLWPYSYFEHCHAHLGDRFTVYAIDLPPLVFLADPSEIRAVLSGDPANLHPGEGAAMIAPVIGESSFMLLEEEEHAIGRRVITPAFHHRMVAHQTAMLSDVVVREVATWPLDTPIPLYPRIRALTLRVILRVIFGEQDSTLKSLHERLITMLSITTSLILQEPKLRYVPGWRTTWRQFVRQRVEVNDLIDGLLTRRRGEADPQRGDLLDMLLTSENTKGPMPDRQIRDNLMSMIIAGHETTTGELGWAFQLLAHNPNVQDCLIDEIDHGSGDDYLTATVHETLRRRPVFLFTIPRKVVEPIEIGGWTYEPPAHLAACTYLMHHNPDLYPKPYEFRPERFIDEAQQPRTWLPWGGGRKHCLGRHFALLEVKAILREVLTTRRISPAASHIEHPRWRSAILVPRGGSRVILKKR
jgi:cytochrome P450